MSDARRFDRKEPQHASGQMGGRPMGGPAFRGAIGMTAEKAKDVKGTLRTLLPYLKPSLPALFLVLLTSILATAFSVVGPRLLGRATTILFRGLSSLSGTASASAGSTGPDFAAIGRILLGLCLLYAASAFFNYIQQYVMAGIAQRLVYNLRRDVQAKLDRLPLAFFDGRSHGEIMSRTTNDIDTISTTLQQSLTQLITSAVAIVGVLAMMLLISPLMTLIALVSLPLAAFGTSRIARHSRKHFSDQQKSLGELTGKVEEAYGGHRVVVAFGRERRTIETFDEVNERLYRSGLRAQFVSGLIMPMMQFINNLGYVAVCIAGGFLAAQRAVEIGDIQAFLQYMRHFTMPIVQTATMANIIQSTIAAAERVFALLAEREESPDAVAAVSASAAASAAATAPDGKRGSVAFQGVCFSYRPDASLIEGLDLEVAPGQKIAIVGHTGAGKTTLVNLLMRFYELGSGRILVDGADIRDLPRGRHRSRFGMVLQDTWLFNGSIRDNIAYGRLDATEDDIVRAAQTAQADHFIRTLPDGYATVLNEEASNISQGQKQLLTIARAVLADPAVLILDEATSSVDTRTELLIRKALETLMVDRTSFIIAHRLSTIRDASLILVMDGGSIVERGTHAQLLASGGVYADLYASQFAGVEEPAAIA